MSVKGSLSLPGWESTQGEKNRNAKLVEENVREIRNSHMTYEELAVKFRVSVHTISNIKRGLRWGHVE